MSKYTDEEMQARIDAALDGYEGQDGDDDLAWGPDPAGSSVDRDLVDAIGEVDSPFGAIGGAWAEIARQAWEALTDEPVLPGWFDDLTTVGEMARRSGRERSEVTDVLDTAKDTLGNRMLIMSEQAAAAMAAWGVSADDAAAALSEFGALHRRGRRRGRDATITFDVDTSGAERVLAAAAEGARRLELATRQIDNRMIWTRWARQVHRNESEARLRRAMGRQQHPLWNMPGAAGATGFALGHAWIDDARRWREQADRQQDEWQSAMDRVASVGLDTDGIREALEAMSSGPMGLHPPLSRAGQMGLLDRHSRPMRAESRIGAELVRGEAFGYLWSDTPLDQDDGYWQRVMMMGLPTGAERDQEQMRVLYENRPLMNESDLPEWVDEMRVEAGLPAMEPRNIPCHVPEPERPRNRAERRGNSRPRDWEDPMRRR